MHAYVDVYISCVCIVGHNGDYTTPTTVFKLFVIDRNTWCHWKKILHETSRQQMWIWKFIERDSLTSEHKITPDGLQFIKINQSIGCYGTFNFCYVYKILRQPWQTWLYIYIYIYIYIYKENLKKNRVIQKWWIYYKGKSKLKHFGLSKHLSRL